jgi:hypothetical protein
MNSPLFFIIKPKEKRYNNEKKVGDSKLILNTDIQDHKYVSKEAIVIATPVLYNGTVKKGDTVMVHHNVFRRFNDVHGNEKNSKSYFKEDMYFCSIEQLYSYKQGEKWFAMEGFCFVQPLERNQGNVYSNNQEEPLVGVVKITDDSDLVNKEELVGFTPESEFEFIIDNKRLYRVPLKSIAIKYEYQGNEKEYHPSWL